MYQKVSTQFLMSLLTKVRRSKLNAFRMMGFSSHVTTCFLKLNAELILICSKVHWMSLRIKWKLPKLSVGSMSEIKMYRVEYSNSEATVSRKQRFSLKCVPFSFFCSYSVNNKRKWKDGAIRNFMHCSVTSPVYHDSWIPDSDLRLKLPWSLTAQLSYFNRYSS